MIRRPPRSTRSPYTAFFRSGVVVALRQGRPEPGVGPPLEQLPQRPDRDAQGQGDHADADVVLQVRLVAGIRDDVQPREGDRKSTRLNSSHANISYAVFCLKK